MEDVSVDRVRNALEAVMHPEIEGHNLVDLGMIKDIVVEGSRVDITLALPFEKIPIKDDLVRSIRKAASALSDGLNIQVSTVEMTQKERAQFMAYSQGGGLSESHPENNIAHVVAVMSGKGGVGKSSVAGLLAVALHRQGYRVGVLDADITGPSIPKMFGVQQHPVGGPAGILPVGTKTGISLMSINLLLQSEDQAVIWRGPLISKAIQQFWHDIAWGDLDYLVVDSPPGLSALTTTLLRAVDTLIVPQQCSFTALYGLRELTTILQEIREVWGAAPEILGIVITMFRRTRHGTHIIEVVGERFGDVLFDTVIPLTVRLQEAPEYGLPIVEYEPQNPAAQAFEELAKEVVERCRAQNPPADLPPGTPS